MRSEQQRAALRTIERCAEAARDLGVPEIECRKAIAGVYLASNSPDYSETPEQAAIRYVMDGEPAGARPYIVTQDGTRIERDTGRSLRGHDAAFAAARHVYEIDGDGKVLRVVKDVDGRASFAPGMRFIPADIIAELVTRDPVRVTVAGDDEKRRVEREGLSAVGKALGIEGGQ